MTENDHITSAILVKVIIIIIIIIIIINKTAVLGPSWCAGR